jgi:hypothetical protein
VLLGTLHPPGICKISKDNHDGRPAKKKRATPCNIHVLPLLNRRDLKQLAHFNVRNFILTFLAKQVRGRRNNITWRPNHMCGLDFVLHYTPAHYALVAYESQSMNVSCSCTCLQYGDSNNVQYPVPAVFKSFV